MLRPPVSYLQSSVFYLVLKGMARVSILESLFRSENISFPFVCCALLFGGTKMGSGNVFVDSPFVQVDFNVVSCFSCLESASLPQQVFMAHLFRLGMRCSHFQDAYEVSMEIFNGPSCNSLMPLLVKPETFENAVAWNSGIFQACAVFGPIVAGAILAMGVPTWGVLLFNARETRAELVRKDEQPFTRWNLTFLPHLFDFDRAGELSTLGLCIFFCFCQ